MVMLELIEIPSLEVHVYNVHVNVEWSSCKILQDVGGGKTELYARSHPVMAI